MRTLRDPGEGDLNLQITTPGERAQMFEIGSDKEGEREREKKRD